MKTTSQMLKSSAQSAMRPAALNPEASHFALLQRLAPALRHKLVGKLHPIGLLASLAERRLNDATPNVAAASDGLAKIKIHAQLATVAGLDVIAWLGVDNRDTLLVTEGVEDLLDMIRIELQLGGASIETAHDTGDARVPARGLRCVLGAALYALLDQQATGTELKLATRATPSTVNISISSRYKPLQGEANDRPTQRIIGWDDVHALAARDEVEVMQRPASFSLQLARKLV